jgi:hypothetical protein
LNERFEQYINGKRENLHSNFTLRLKKILWEARSTPTLVQHCFYDLGSHNSQIEFCIFGKIYFSNFFEKLPLKFILLHLAQFNCNICIFFEKLIFKKIVHFTYTQGHISTQFIYSNRDVYIAISLCIQGVP